MNHDGPGVFAGARRFRPHAFLALLAASAFAVFGNARPTLAREGDEPPSGQDDILAHVDSQALADGSYHYTITLTNAGSDTIGTFWYAWVPGKSFLPTVPTNVQSPANWTARVTTDGPTDGHAILWSTGTTAPLTPGHSLTFSFDSTDTPTTLQSASTIYPTFPVGTSFVYKGAAFSDPGVQFVASTGPSTFFHDDHDLGEDIHFLTLPNGNPFGYYSYLSDDHYIYHQDLGFEYVFDAADGNGGMFLYDFASDSFLYTSSATGFPFPYLYDFKLNSIVYYFPDPSPDRHGRYNTDGVRYFYVFSTGEVIHK